MIIMPEQFVNREQELAWLEGNRRGKRNRSVIYGRRRVGKTELIRRFMGGKPHIYFLATNKTEKEKIRFGEMGCC